MDASEGVVRPSHSHPDWRKQALCLGWELAGARVVAHQGRRNFVDPGLRGSPVGVAGFALDRHRGIRGHNERQQRELQERPGRAFKMHRTPG